VESKSIDTAIFFALRDSFNYSDNTKEFKRVNRLKVNHITKIDDNPNIILIINESFGKNGLSFLSETFNRFHKGSIIKKNDLMPSLISNLKKYHDRVYIFPNAYTNSPSTELSIPSILTGVNPSDGSLKLNTAPLLWDWTKAAGYKTIFVSSQIYDWHSFDELLFSPGPDIHLKGKEIDPEPLNAFGIDDLSSVMIIDDLLKNISHEQKILLSVVTNALHIPYQTKSKFLKEQPKGKSSYQKALSFLDIVFNKLINVLKSHKRLKNSLIIITSDHGEYEKRWRPTERLFSFYEEIINIPFIVIVPESWTKNKTRYLDILDENIHKNISNLDIVPTVIDILELTKKSKNKEITQLLNGKSLLKKINSDRFIISFNYDRSEKIEKIGMCLIENKKRLLYNNLKGFEYYNLKNDSFQKINIWNSLGKSSKEKLIKILQEKSNINSFLFDG
jgi:arylsulfatase A-like enzyme